MDGREREVVGGINGGDVAAYAEEPSQMPADADTTGKVHGGGGAMEGLLEAGAAKRKKEGDLHV